MLITVKHTSWLLCLLAVLLSPAAQGSAQLSADLQQIHASYQHDSNWFAASAQLQVQVRRQQIAVPVYAWVTNLVPPRLQGTNLYQVCRACFLHGDADGTQDYLRDQHSWSEHLHTYMQKARQLTRPAWWSNAAQRARGSLQRLYHERGILSAVFVGLTWLPYTAITEGVIEPILIGPLHTICPLFQVAYFSTLNFTHTLYRNLRHSLTFGDDALTLSSRLRLASSGWRRFPRGTWHIAGEEVHSKDITAELDDAVLTRLLSSPLRPVVAATLLSRDTSLAVRQSTEPMWQSIQRELTQVELLRRVYFVATTVAAARALIALHASHLDARLQDGTLAASNYRQLQGQLGALQRDVFTLALHLKKLIVITQVLDNSHSDTVWINFQQVAKLTQRALQALLVDLQKIFQLQTSEELNLAGQVAKFAEYNFILNVTTKK